MRVRARTVGIGRDGCRAGAGRTMRRAGRAEGSRSTCRRRVSVPPERREDRSWSGCQTLLPSPPRTPPDNLPAPRIPAAHRPAANAAPACRQCPTMSAPVPTRSRVPSFRCRRIRSSPASVVSPVPAGSCSGGQSPPPPPTRPTRTPPTACEWQTIRLRRPTATPRPPRNTAADARPNAVNSVRSLRNRRGRLAHAAHPRQR